MNCNISSGINQVSIEILSTRRALNEWSISDNKVEVIRTKFNLVSADEPVGFQPRI